LECQVSMSQSKARCREVQLGIDQKQMHCPRPLLSSDSSYQDRAPPRATSSPPGCRGSNRNIELEGKVRIKSREHASAMHRTSHCMHSQDQGFVPSRLRVAASGIKANRATDLCIVRIHPLFASPSSPAVSSMASSVTSWMPCKKSLYTSPVKSSRLRGGSHTPNPPPPPPPLLSPLPPLPPLPSPSPLLLPPPPAAP